MKHSRTLSLSCCTTVSRYSFHENGLYSGGCFESNNSWGGTIKSQLGGCAKYAREYRSCFLFTTALCFALLYLPLLITYTPINNKLPFSQPSIKLLVLATFVSHETLTMKVLLHCTKCNKWKGPNWCAPVACHQHWWQMLLDVVARQPMPHLWVLASHLHDLDAKW